MKRDYSEQEKIRRESLKQIQQLGINPFPAEEYSVSTNSQEIKEKYSKKENNLQEVKTQLKNFIRFPLSSNSA